MQMRSRAEKQGASRWPWYWFHVVVTNVTYQVCGLLSEKPGIQSVLGTDPGSQDFLFAAFQYAFAMPVFFGFFGAMAVGIGGHAILSFPRIANRYVNVCRRVDERFGRRDGFAKDLSEVLPVSIVGAILVWFF